MHVKYVVACRTLSGVPTMLSGYIAIPDNINPIKPEDYEPIIEAICEDNGMQGPFIIYNNTQFSMLSNVLDEIQSMELSNGQF